MLNAIFKAIKMIWKSVQTFSFFCFIYHPFLDKSSTYCWHLTFDAAIIGENCLLHIKHTPAFFSKKDFLKNNWKKERQSAAHQNI